MSSGHKIDSLPKDEASFRKLIKENSDMAIKFTAIIIEGNELLRDINNNLSEIQKIDSKNK